jgi:hypothetical protein
MLRAAPSVQPHRAGGIFRCFKLTHGSGRQIVDLIRLNLLDDANEVGGIRQVTVVHEKARLMFVRIDVQVVDTCGIERRR